MPYTSQRKEKEPIAEGWCFFFFKQTVDIFVRNLSEFAHMVILSLMLFLIFTE